MTFDAFLASLTDADAAPPPDVGANLAALWHLRRGEWERAHAIVQEESAADAAWVHAHLHRVEGDLGNARYWYDRAGRPECTTTTDEEWGDIVRDFLNR